MVGMPVEQLFQGLLLPALIIFAILWALLGSIRVFNRKINLVLSLALTILVVGSPQFVYFSTYLTQLGAQVAIAAFFLLFAVGSVFWFLRKGTDIYYEQNPSKRIERLVKKKAECLRKARQAADNGKPAEHKEWLKKAREYNDELDMLMTKE